jgi:mRNA interferase HigB
MRVIAKPALGAFWEKHPDAEQSLKSWYHEAIKAEWKSPADIKLLYRSASILKKSRVVFNISGNKYRLVVKVEYEWKLIYIRFTGTHEEYNLIDANTI